MAKPALTIAVAQPTCVPFDVAANARVHASTVRSAAARVIVFPELSLTGYELTAPPVTPEDPRLRVIASACAETGSIALVGAAVPGAAGLQYIAIIAIDGANTFIAYRKRFLGSAETEHFAPGPQPAVIEVDGWRLGLAICKDTGIEQHDADTAALGMDVYLAGIVHGEDEIGVHDARARRIATAHHVYVAIASHAGPTGGGYDRTAGRSGIWAPDGTVIAQTGPELDAIARATLR